MVDTGDDCELERLRRWALLDGLDDWVACYTMLDEARRRMRDERAAFDLVVRAAAGLAGEGFVRLGWIDRVTGWHYYADPSQAVLDDLRSRFEVEGTDACWEVWLDLTSAGDAEAERLEVAGYDVERPI